MRRDGKVQAVDKAELGVALGLLALCLLIGSGALDLPSTTGYARVGPRLFPWLVAMGTGLVGAWLAVQALRGGWSRREPVPADGGFGLRALEFSAWKNATRPEH